MDFVRDAKDILAHRLVAAGYSIDPGDDLHAVAIKYYNVALRSILPRPRTVHESRELICPPNLATAFAILKSKITNGGDLTPHLSKGLLDATYSDLLLNDWGIHHFHLGTAIQQSGFTDRTGDLLFARVEHDNVYMISIQPHNGAWTDEQLLEVVQSNWPTVLDQYRLKDVLDVELPPTRTERNALRKAGLQPLIRLANGDVLGPPGGGLMANRVSVRVRRAATELRSRGTRLQNPMTDLLPAWRATIEAQGSTVPATLRLRLSNVQAGVAEVLEEQTGATLQANL